MDWLDEVRIKLKRKNQVLFAKDAEYLQDLAMLFRDQSHMPTWKKKGNIIHFAVSKNHIGVHVGEDAVAHFNERLNGIEIYKGVIRLKPDQEIPLTLISDIARWCFTRDQIS